MNDCLQTMADIIVRILDDKVAVAGIDHSLDLVDYAARDRIRYVHTPDDIRASDDPVIYLPHCGRHGFTQEMGEDIAARVVTAVLLTNPENLLAAFETAHYFAESHVPTQIIVYRMTATDDERDRGIEDKSHDDLQDLIMTTPVAMRLDRITMEISQTPTVRINDVMIQRLAAMIEAEELEQMYRMSHNS